MHNCVSVQCNLQTQWRRFQINLKVQLDHVSPLFCFTIANLRPMKRGNSDMWQRIILCWLASQYRLQASKCSGCCRCNTCRHIWMPICLIGFVGRTSTLINLDFYFSQDWGDLLKSAFYLVESNNKRYGEKSVCFVAGSPSRRLYQSSMLKRNCWEASIQVNLNLQSSFNHVYLKKCFVLMPFLNREQDYRLIIRIHICVYMYRF